ncbi:SDR family NAD(P)-dependent oxidoreductase [Rhodoblastus sp.]|uniref:SDR family NAD(P)-dependent oxidoreductase n=1 Tax=Rhodoblastus sp. TaxID=1962975 RepID=UPI003144F374
MTGIKGSKRPAAARAGHARKAPRPVAVVFGVGPENGLGAALARRFAREGHVVVLAGRTPEKLEKVASAIAGEGGEAWARVTDATSARDVGAALDFASIQGALDLVVYNVGSNRAAPALDTSAELFESLWRQNALGGFIVGREAAARLLTCGRGSILFTGATASLRARPPFTAFASAKAALRAVAQGLAREFGPRGVHVAHVVVDGVIDGDYAAENFPDLFAAKGAGGRLNSDAIAEAYWAIHRQHPSAWSHEIDLRPFSETF